LSGGSNLSLKGGGGGGGEQQQHQHQRRLLNMSGRSGRSGKSGKSGKSGRSIRTHTTSGSCFNKRSSQGGNTNSGNTHSEYYTTDGGAYTQTEMSQSEGPGTGCKCISPERLIVSIILDQNDALLLRKNYELFAPERYRHGTGWSYGGNGGESSQSDCVRQRRLEQHKEEKEAQRKWASIPGVNNSKFLRGRNNVSF